MSDRPKCLRCGAGAEWIEGKVPNEPKSEMAPATGSAKITQRQLESILINEGIIQAAAIEDPEGYDDGRTGLAMTIATQQINELLSPNAEATGSSPVR